MGAGLPLYRLGRGGAGAGRRVDLLAGEHLRRQWRGAGAGQRLGHDVRQQHEQQPVPAERRGHPHEAAAGGVDDAGAVRLQLLRQYRGSGRPAGTGRPEVGEKRRGFLLPGVQETVLHFCRILRVTGEKAGSRAQHDEKKRNTPVVGMESRRRMDFITSTTRIGARVRCRWESFRPIHTIASES